MNTRRINDWNAIVETHFKWGSNVRSHNMVTINANPEVLLGNYNSSKDGTPLIVPIFL